MSSSHTVEKKALLISPSYTNSLTQLPGTKIDLENVRKLTKRFSFDDVREVTGENATKANILQALDEFSKSAKDDSIVLLYYTGHGFYLVHSQDEGLVPSCATLDTLTNAANEACITGQDLAQYLQRLSRKRVKCTLIFDCCYSGQLYRMTKLKDPSSSDGLLVRQVVIEKSPPTTPAPVPRQQKGLRGGWVPHNKDCFYYIAACSPSQLAWEVGGMGGRLTWSMDKVLESLTNASLDKVSVEAFFRLIVREFQGRNWDKNQSPQLEGTNLKTALFGAHQIPVAEGGVKVNNTSNGEVVLDGGCLNNLMPGRYEVFEPTVDKDSVSFGRSSNKWLCDIEVLEGNIGPMKSSAFILEQSEGVSNRKQEIAHGCIAYLRTPGNLKSNVYIDVAMDTVPIEKVNALMEYLHAIHIVNVHKHPLTVEDHDLITIKVEKFETLGETRFWVARRRGSVLVPVMSLGQEFMMAENISRLLRYKSALQAAQSPPSKGVLLDNVSFKVKKIEKVKNFGKNSILKEEIIKTGLGNGVDMYADPTQEPAFMSHSLNNASKLEDETGDALVFQVTNGNTRTEDRRDVFHVCVISYQLDGSIQGFPTFGSGHTKELRGGDTIEGISRVYIPTDALRTMAEPDPSKNEPNIGIDTLAVYVTSHPADYGPLLQTGIQNDPDAMMSRGKRSKPSPLSEWSLFTQAIPRHFETCSEEGVEWFVFMKELFVMKNTTS